MAIDSDEGVDWLRIGASDGEHGNDPSSSIKGKEFLDQLSDYKLLNRECAPWS
jgi:hypothetical protein